MKTLIIVESSKKTETISKILGKNYVVEGCNGHIIELPKETMSINFETFEPIYQISDGKQHVIKKLKSKLKNCSECLIATDKDREGEMIAWSLAKELKIKNPKRITFGSITKTEINNALSKVGKIDDDMVNAQKVRRMLDRIIGYKISPILKNNTGGKSAGRVQSVVVKLIIEKENEIAEFFKNESSSSFKTTAVLSNDDINLKCVLYENKKNKIYKLTSYEKANKLMVKLSKSNYMVDEIEYKNSIQNPVAPFTTSTLQQEALNKFGMASKTTMMTAQKLYEGGYITYIRTDSMSLSDDGMKLIKDFILDEYGDEYYKGKNYVPKIKNTQDAHEAIRPTDKQIINKCNNLESSDDSTIGINEIKLYCLIWKRTIASQMTEAKFKLMIININISKLDEQYFRSETKSLIFNGFLAVYNLKNIDDEFDECEKNIKIKEGIMLDASIIEVKQEYDTPPTRYNESKLLNKMDPSDLNIGRPSTYATIIETIQKAGYIENKSKIDGFAKECKIIEFKNNKITEKTKTIMLGQDKNKFVPTDISYSVVDYLNTNFPKIMDYKFTADMEKDLDEIAIGKKDWFEIIKNFYDELMIIVNKLVASTIPKDSNILGIHPDLGYTIVAQIAKSGPVVKMLADKPVYASIKRPNTLKNITLDKAIKLLEYPKHLGDYEEKPVMLCKGKFGPYIKYNNSNYTIDNNKEDDFDCDLITLELAIKYIDKKNDSYLWTGFDKTTKYIISESKHGKYIRIINNKKKSKIVGLPYHVDIDKITIDIIREIIKNDEKKKKYNKFNKYKKKKVDDESSK